MMQPRTSPVLITGCSTGIGRATAIRLARTGRIVYATARRIDSIDDLRSHGCHILQLDVTDDASMTAAVDRVLHEQGRVGSLVNNAGYTEVGPIEYLTMEAVRTQFETNVFGTVRMCQLVLPGMRNAGHGRIINVGSMGAHFALPLMGAYTGSKAAIAALTETLRIEVEQFGVQVTLIEPGFIRTDFVHAAHRKISENTATQGTHYAAGMNGLREILTDIARRIDGNPSGSTPATLPAKACAAMLARLSADPAAVVRAIERTLNTRRPRPHHLVTKHAHAAVAAHHLMTDRQWGIALRILFGTHCEQDDLHRLQRPP